jgi:hypothetical protein
MGMDTTIRIRFFKNDLDNFKEISNYADHDNYLDTLFHGDKIYGTSIHFNRKNELTAEENECLDLIIDENEEIRAYSKIMESSIAFNVFDKVYRKLFPLKSEALLADLSNIDLLDIVQEEKVKMKKNKIRSYLGFENSISALLGLLKTANDLEYKVQIVAEYY